MKCPKIHSAKAINNYTLLIEFDNKQFKEYNISQLLKKEMFAPLSNPTLFRNVGVELGGYAVSWNCDIDISEYELWKHGQTVNPSTL